MGPGGSQWDHPYPLPWFQNTVFWFLNDEAIPHMTEQTGSLSLNCVLYLRKRYRVEKVGISHIKASGCCQLLFISSGSEVNLLVCCDWTCWSDSWLELLYLICCGARTWRWESVVYRVLWQSCIYSSVYSVWKGIMCIPIFGIIDRILINGAVVDLFSPTQPELHPPQQTWRASRYISLGC